MACFIACSKTKRKYPCMAKYMYMGSLFTKSFQFCKKFYSKQPIFILSAKYGLLTPEQIIEPYEKTLNTFTQKELITWSNMIQKQLKVQNIKKPYIFLTGKKYQGTLQGLNIFGNLSFGKR